MKTYQVINEIPISRSIQFISFSCYVHLIRASSLPTKQPLNIPPTNIAIYLEIIRQWSVADTSQYSEIHRHGPGDLPFTSQMHTNKHGGGGGTYLSFLISHRPILLLLLRNSLRIAVKPRHGPPLLQYMAPVDTRLAVIFQRHLRPGVACTGSGYRWAGHSA